MVTVAAPVAVTTPYHRYEQYCRFDDFRSVHVVTPPPEIVKEPVLIAEARTTRTSPVAVGDTEIVLALATA